MAKRPPPKCVKCSRLLDQAATGRPPSYCSPGCKQRAYLDRIREAGREAGREEAIEELRGRSFLA